MKNNKDALLRIRCQSDWYDRVKEKAAERGETITRYVTTCIALGESVLDGTIFTTPEEDDNDGF